MKTVLLLFLLCFIPQQTKQNKILFIGDSMTTYTGGWHHQFAKKLGVEYDNFSIGGKRTDWMSITLTNVLSKNDNYKTCFIYGGINDGFSYVKVESAITNLQRMVDLCNQHGIEPVIIMGFNPKDVMINLRIKNADFHVKRYIEIQRLMISNLKNCKIIPISEGITRQDTDDGIHFKYTGHRKFAEWVYIHYTK